MRAGTETSACKKKSNPPRGHVAAIIDAVSASISRINCVFLPLLLDAENSEAARMRSEGSGVAEQERCRWSAKFVYSVSWVTMVIRHANCSAVGKHEDPECGKRAEKQGRPRGNLRGYAKNRNNNHSKQASCP